MVLRFGLLFGLVLLLGCPRPADEHLRKGNVYFTTKNFDEAAKAYELAAEADPKSARAREGRGNVDYERGDLAGAEMWYRKAIEANGREITPRHKLALTLAARNDYAGAIEALKAAVEIAHDNPYALSTMGGFYKKLGKLDDAEKSQLAALDVDPDYHAARYALGNLLVDTGRLEDAQRQFTRLASNGAEALADYGFARIAAKGGKPADAATHLDKVLAGPMSEPRRILEDPVFEAHWGDPKMATVRGRLITMTSTAS